MTEGYLVLEDGQCFEGCLTWSTSEAVTGEVVFTTGMTGYCESLTDPSYEGQILVFTYPLQGNYGVSPPDKWESHRVHAAGVVLGEACEDWSHSEGIRSLVDWLTEQNVPVLSGVDTRQVTKVLREAGVMLGGLSSSAQPMLRSQDPNAMDLVARVTSPIKEQHPNPGKPKVVVVDCGMKANILRSLKQYPIEMEVVPYDHDYTNDPFDGIFISNGPGDPARCATTIDILKAAMKKQKPTYGICLGAQLMALAAGASTYKLRYGHRGHNQPCLDTQTQRCYITSQNHGYAIKESSLPVGWCVSFRNLNDGTVEGIRHHELPFHAVQFHPEAAPGPTDTLWFFEQFAESLR